MATAYDRGAAFERRMIAEFEKAGYWAMRSSISRGAADFIALDMAAPGRPALLVQCKRTRAAVDPASWNRLLTIATATGAVPLEAVAVFDGAKVPRVVGHELYKITGPKTAETARFRRTPWEPWTLRSAEERAEFVTLPYAAPAWAVQHPATDDVEPVGPTTYLEPGSDVRCGVEMSTHKPCPIHRPEAFEPTPERVPSCSQGCTRGCDTGCPNWRG